MNLFQLVFKQMRQRALSTWLTLLSVLLGVGLAVAIMILHRESAALFGQTDFGYDIIIGPPKGSPLQLVLNTVYHLDVSPGAIPYSLYEDMARKQAIPSHTFYGPYVKIAVPFMVGDSYKGRRIVGTSPLMFGIGDDGKPESTKFEYRRGKSYELASGRVFHPRKFEGVIGSEVAETQHLAVYDDKLSEAENEKRGATFQATHGFPAPNEKPDIHKPKWHVVGILKATHTANDRVLYVPVISLYAIEEHEVGVLKQILMKAGVDPSRVPPAQLPAVLRQNGIDPDKLPAAARKELHLAISATKPTSAPAAAPGELMRDTGGGELMKDVPKTPEKPPAKEEGKNEGDEDEDAYKLNPDGTIVPYLEPEEWKISAILVRSRGEGFQAQQLMYNFKLINDQASAVNPAEQMRQFFDTFLKPGTVVLLIVSLLVTIVAAVGILVSIYNAVSARMREIAILRALGATRGKVLTMICCEAGLVGLIGGVLGLLVGHLGSAAGSSILEQKMGQGINWVSVGGEELLYLLLVVVLAILAGLVPAMKAYRTPVATNLVGG